MAEDQEGMVSYGPGSEGQGLKLQDIESELGRLWSQARDDNAEGPKLSRTVLLTLVIVAPQAEKVPEIQRMVAAVATDHPCRSIVITDSGRPGGVSAEVSISCQLVTRSDQQVCCEQILIDSGGQGLADLAGAVLPLTLPDVPVVLWTTECGRNEEGFERLMQAADRLLLDARNCDSAGCSLEWIHDLNQQAAPGVIDLAWVELARYRLSVAQMFDPERWRGCLPSVNRVEIAWDDAAGEQPPAQALLLGGWIAGTLHWRDFSFEGRDGEAYKFESADGRSLVLRPAKGHGCGRLKDVHLETDRSLFHVHFDESHREAVLRVTQEGHQLDGDVVNVEDYQPEQLLCGALEIAGRDPVYVQAVDVAQQLLSLMP